MTEFAVAEEKVKDFWDKADIVGKLSIPLAIAAATSLFTYILSNNQAKENEAVNKQNISEKKFEVAVGVLQAPVAPQYPKIRDWAIKTFGDETGVSPDVIKELLNGGQIPSTSQLRLPTPGQIRVFIIRPDGAAVAPSESIQIALRTAGYNNITLVQIPLADFPSKTEVRFYYPSDSDNARALNVYMNQNLGLKSELIDNSQNQHATEHQLHDLHIYVK